MDFVTFDPPAKILGISRRFYPTQYGWPGTDKTAEAVFDQSMDPPGVLVVLVEGDIGDYAAYCGLGEPQWVAAHGDKISFEEACCHFPGGQLTREKYRI